MDPAIRLLRELVAVNSVNPTLVRGATKRRIQGRAKQEAKRRKLHCGRVINVRD